MRRFLEYLLKLPKQEKREFIFLIFGLFIFHTKTEEIIKLAEGSFMVTISIVFLVSVFSTMCLYMIKKDLDFILSKRYKKNEKKRWNMKYFSLLFSSKTVDRIFDPIIADSDKRYYMTLDSGDKKLCRKIRIQLAMDLLITLIFHVYFKAKDKVLGMFKIR